MIALRRALFLARVSRGRPGQRQYLHRWAQSLRPGHLLDAAVPWITFEAADFIAGHVGARPRVFEYGSGGSTLFWLRLGAEVVSVEHEASWHRAVRERAGAGARLDYRLVLPEDADALRAGDEARPERYRSADPLFRRHTFRRYAEQIDEFPDGSFDAVLVDGRARASCIAHGARKVRPGGLLILDNAERGYYTAQNAGPLGGFEARQFSGIGPCLNWEWTTTCYVRRASNPDR